MDTVIAYLLALSLPLWLVVEELLHWRANLPAADYSQVRLELAIYDDEGMLRGRAPSAAPSSPPVAMGVGLAAGVASTVAHSGGSLVHGGWPRRLRRGGLQ
jgi:hypothetical protein